MRSFGEDGGIPLTAAARGPHPTIGTAHAIALCVGVVVGAGIFRVPALVAGASADETIFLATWLLGGLLSILGGLCYAELASTYPSAGGDYHFLQRAYGSRVAFLYGWARLTVVQTGSLALLAYLFGDYASALVPLGPFGSSIYAAALVIGLTALNWSGTRNGAGAQLWLTALEVLGVCTVIVAGLFLAPAAVPQAVGEREGALGLVLVFVLLTYGGWSEVACLSAELRDARRRMAPVLIVSLLIITLIYFLVNWAYLRVLGLEGVARSEVVAADLMELAIGPAGAAFISLVVALSALTSANATAITGARTTYTVGRSFARLGWLGHWGPRDTPGNALLVQGLIALLLIIAGAFARDGFRTVVEYTAPVFWLFLLLVGIAQFVLRSRDPDVTRPFRTPFYPFLPAVFCATSAYLLYSSLAYTGAGALVGVGVLALGGILLIFIRPLHTEEVH